MVHEIATQVIKEGKILPWVDRGKFQAEVLRRQMAAESSILDFDKPVFLDRGAFDGEAYYLYDRMPVPPIFSTIDPSQYDVAFLIEPLTFFDANDVRREDLEFTLEITKIIEQCYRDKRIKVIRVPAMEPDKRVDFVIDSVEKLRATAVRSPEQAGLDVPLHQRRRSYRILRHRRAKRLCSGHNGFVAVYQPSPEGLYAISLYPTGCCNGMAPDLS